MAAPSKLGRYELRHILGQGAMGVVYEGYDPTLSRRVAVKTILQSHALGAETTRDYSARFTREAKAAARLNHPNIVQVYDFGVEGDVAYLVMEFIQGRELRAFFDQDETFGIEESVRIMCELLDALDFAHAGSVIHRDIKPANVMLDSQRRVKLADFGVARIQDSSDRSQAGTMVGTPAYMSPEQIQGGKIDNRTDLFSAGSILYQFLTGERPFKGAGAWTVAKMIVQDEPPLPSTVVSTASPVFDAIVRKALAKDPARRFQNAKEFAGALREGLKAEMKRTSAEDTVRMAAPAPAPRPETPGRSAQEKEAEVEFWRSIKDGNDAAEFEFYLRKFPAGIYVDLAQHKLAKLRGAARAAVPVQKTAAAEPPAATPPKKSSLALAAAIAMAVAVAAGVGYFAVVKHEKTDAAKTDAAAEQRAQEALARQKADAERKAAEQAAAEKARENERTASAKSAAAKAEEERKVAANAEAEKLAAIAKTEREAKQKAAQEIARLERVRSEKEAAERAAAARIAARRAAAEKAAAESTAEKAKPGSQAGEEANRAGNEFYAKRMYSEAVAQYRIGADQNHARALASLGLMYVRGEGVARDHAEALRWLRRGAEQNEPRALIEMGVIYAYGRGVATDYPEAMRYFRKAAELNVALAWAQLGWMHHNGHGTPRDYAESMRLYRRAADLNNAMGINGVGFLYANGFGVTQDYKEAFRWFSRAAEMNHGPAQAWMGYYYENALGGMTKDVEEAKKWYRRAAAQGVDSAIKGLQRLGN